MRRVLSRVSRSVAVLAVLVGGAGRAGAGPLNPEDFPLSDSGVFPTAAGTFNFDTSNLTLTGPGITTPIQGSLSTTGVAVFDFNAITVASDQVLVSQNPSFVTTPPLALLSRGDITIDGKIDLSVPQVFITPIFSPGGPGGFGSDRGPGAAAAAFLVSLAPSPPPVAAVLAAAAVTAVASTLSPVLPALPPATRSSLLEEGAAAAVTATWRSRFKGGAAAEVSAVGPPAPVAAAAVRLRSAQSVGSQSAAASWRTATAAAASAGRRRRWYLSARRFGGALEFECLDAQGGGSGAGGGGGGRVLIEVGPGGFTGDVGSINVSGGPGGSPFGGPFSGGGAPGVITITAPRAGEPGASWHRSARRARLCRASSGRMNCPITFSHRSFPKQRKRGYWDRLVPGRNPFSRASSSCFSSF